MRLPLGRPGAWPLLLLVVLIAAVVVALAAGHPGGNPDGPDTALFVAWAAAMLLLFSAGIRLPLQPALGRWSRPLFTAAVAAGAVLVTVAANVALYRHDAHFDLSRERLSTPSPASVEVVRGLTRDVAVTYFYQAQDPNGRRAKELLELLARRGPRLKLATVDPDRQPRLAETFGVRLYNAAVIEVDGRRVQVQSTDDREIALGIVRALRQHTKTACFMEGHGEYSIDNFEFHTHFETLQNHSHSGIGETAVLTERHGVGRFRRALESLGIVVKKIVPASLRELPADCSVVVDANPRTSYLPVESAMLQDYLARGGRALLMYDVGFPIEAHLSALLARLGVVLRDEVIVDPVDHYSTDVETLAVPTYEPHPITRKLALTFFPGARPVELLPPPPGVTVAPLFTSSRQSSIRVPGRERTREVTPAPAKQARVLAVAVEGRLVEAAGPFRAVIAGDSDFSSNSYFPYMANGELSISMIRWLLGEEEGPRIRPRTPVLPLVTLTGRQMQGIFLVVEILLPLAVVAVGSIVYWRRR